MLFGELKLSAVFSATDHRLILADFSLAVVCPLLAGRTSSTLSTSQGIEDSRSVLALTSLSHIGFRTKNLIVGSTE